MLSDYYEGESATNSLCDEFLLVSPCYHISAVKMESTMFFLLLLIRIDGQNYNKTEAVS